MQHITALTLKMDVPEQSHVPPFSGMGPYLQGVLIESIDTEYATVLHQLPFNPYSQYCRFDADAHQLEWRVSALTDEAAEKIVTPLHKKDSFFIKKLGVEVPVRTKTIETIGLKSITDLVGSDDQKKSSIDFITPTSFKSLGAYVFMPSVRLILQNLLMRYNHVYANDKEIDTETVDYLDKHVRIVSYSLKSCYFDNVMNEKRKVPAFVGNLTVQASGPQQLIGLVRMLLKFGEYSGIGIKTSMGMGGVLCK